MVITSKNSRHPKTSRVYSSMNLNSRNGPKGDSGPKAQTHKATRKFHAIWCPCVSSFLVSIIQHEDMTMNESFTVFLFSKRSVRRFKALCDIEVCNDT